MFFNLLARIVTSTSCSYGNKKSSYLTREKQVAWNRLTILTASQMKTALSIIYYQMPTSLTYILIYEWRELLSKDHKFMIYKNIKFQRIFTNHRLIAIFLLYDVYIFLSIQRLWSEIIYLTNHNDVHLEQLLNTGPRNQPRLSEYEDEFMHNK